MSWGSLRPALGMGVGEHCPENLGKGCCPESRGPAPPQGIGASTRAQVEHRSGNHLQCLARWLVTAKYPDRWCVAFGHTLSVAPSLHRGC